MNTFTPREKRVLTIVAVTIVALVVATQIRVDISHTFLQKRLLDLSNLQAIEDWAIYPLMFYVLPLGIYIVTDGERIERTKDL